MGQIQGRVFDASTYGWIADVAVSLSASGYPTKLYVDGSLAQRDSSITELSNYNIIQDNSILLKVDKTYVDGSLSTLNSSVNTALSAYATNASIGLANFIKADALYPYATNASVGTALESYATNASVNAAQFIKADSLYPYATNASVGDALKPFATNSSVGTAIAPFATNSSVNTALSAYATNASIGIASFAKDASLVLYVTNASIASANFIKADSLYPYATNSSVGDALKPYATNASVGFAIASFATNASVGTAIQNFSTNASVNESLTQFIKSASTRNGLFWVGGYLDVSVAGGVGDVTKLYVDGSLSALNSSVNTAFTKVIPNASIGASSAHSVYWLNGFLEASMGTGTGDVTKLYVDGSLALRDVSINRLDSSVKDLYTKTSAATTLAGLTDTSIVNASTGQMLVFDPSANLNKWKNITPIDISSLAADASTYFWNIQTKLLREASIGTGFKWVAGLLEPSAAGDVTKAYVDGSLGLRDASILWLQNNITPSSLTIAYVDGSLATRDAAILLRLKEASLNTSYFKWNAGLLEPSIAAVSALSALTDVSIVSASTGQMLVFDPSANANKWKNIMPVDISSLAADASTYFQNKLPFASPSTGTAGTMGMWNYDSSYLYICVSTNAWGRTLLQRPY